MNSGSSEDRQEETQVCPSDNVENVNEPMEEKVPKILSRELHDIFPIFVSMLDVKSFMHLAMTSKDMYKRCTENKAGKINVDVDELHVKKENGSLVFHWQRFEDDYVVATRKVPRNVVVKITDIANNVEVTDLPAFRNYMNEIGVNKISLLVVRGVVAEWEAVFAIINDFKVDDLDFYEPVEADILHSILQLNLKELNYNEPVPIDFILEISSPIRGICFPRIHRLTKNEFMQVLKRVQSGSIIRLVLTCDAVDWNEFDTLPFDQGPLPEHRPLLLKRNSDEEEEDDVAEYWFLHSDGEVTKCTTDIDDLVIFKCEPCDYPWILRKEEDVLKDLAEKCSRIFCTEEQFRTVFNRKELAEERSRISCTEEQFRTVFNSSTMLDPSYKGALPKERPLYCKVSEHCFWLLDENENLTNCNWVRGSAFWNRYNAEYCPAIEHTALAKHMFWYVIKQLRFSDYFVLNTEGFGGIDTLFYDFPQLDFEFSGPLPNTRPLVFKWAPRDKIDDDRYFSWKDEHLRVILMEDRLVECAVFEYEFVDMQLCPYFDRPPVLFTAECVVEMLREQDFQETPEDSTKRNFGIHLRDIISEKTEAEFWFMHDGIVRKIEWEQGRFSNNEADLRESSPNFMKRVFKRFAEKEPKNSFNLELKQFRTCLKQFTVVPFDYSEPLKPDSPLAFVKDEIYHNCRKGARRRPRCNCAESSILVWFLWDGMRVTYCSWGKGGPMKVLFGKSADFNDVPLALKSKEYLKNLLQGKYDESPSFEWFGRFDDFLACLSDYVKLPFDYDGPLSEERPLLFAHSSDEQDPIYFILREDDTVIECLKCASHVSLSLSLDNESVPPALKSIF